MRRTLMALLIVGAVFLLALSPREVQTVPSAFEPYSVEIERDSIVAQEARRAGVPVRLALAVARVENPSADSMAVSKAGAVGLMQVLPRFWRDSFQEECGTGSLFERQRNACVGVRALRHYLNREVSVDRALRCYSGSRRFHEAGDRYVSAVLQELARL